jgi:hypothetical protein
MCWPHPTPHRRWRGGDHRGNGDDATRLGWLTRIRSLDNHLLFVSLHPLDIDAPAGETPFGESKPYPWIRSPLQDSEVVRQGREATGEWLRRSARTESLGFTCEPLAWAEMSIKEVTMTPPMDGRATEIKAPCGAWRRMQRRRVQRAAFPRGTRGEQAPRREPLEVIARRFIVGASGPLCLRRRGGGGHSGRAADDEADDIDEQGDDSQNGKHRRIGE